MLNLDKQEPLYGQQYCSEEIRGSVFSDSVALHPGAAEHPVPGHRSGLDPRILIRALAAMPTLRTIVFERFFDESGGVQLVSHSPFGSRINRAWGLAQRKRFCRRSALLREMERKMKRRTATEQF